MHLLVRAHVRVRVYVRVIVDDRSIQGASGWKRSQQSESSYRIHTTVATVLAHL